MKFTDLESTSTADLFQLFDSMLAELRRRRVIRSKNNPVADYAEFLAIKALGLDRARKSMAGFDAKDASGARYQIKSRRLTDDNKSRQLSFIRGLNEAPQPFDYLAGILFNQDFTVFRACLIPVNAVQELATYRGRENAWRLLLVDGIWERSDVKDITDRIRQASAGFSCQSCA